MLTKLTTLCYLEHEGKYLMLHRVKKKEDVNKGKWIGVGGKFEPGESPEECLIREVREETGFKLTGFRFRGLISFIYADKEPEYIFTYTSSEFENAAVKSDWQNTKAVLNLSCTTADKTHETNANASAAQIKSEAEVLTVPECDEGVFAWVDKDRILIDLELWEGDRYMLNYLLKDRQEAFSLKLCYDAQDNLIEAWEMSAHPVRLK